MMARYYAFDFTERKGQWHAKEAWAAEDRASHLPKVSPDDIIFIHQGDYDPFKTQDSQWRELRHALLALTTDPPLIVFYTGNPVANQEKEEGLFQNAMKPYPKDRVWLLGGFGGGYVVENVLEKYEKRRLGLK